MSFFYNLWRIGYNGKMTQHSYTAKSLRETDWEEILYGWHSSPFGEDMLVALSERGVCWAGFPVGGSRKAGETRMQSHFSHTRFIQEGTSTASALEGLISLWRGEQGRICLPFDLRGTDFQRTVWAALLEIPFGYTVSYQEVAHRIGLPRAARAVGGACGRNPVSVFVPCHRVLAKGGGMGGYGWGILRKKFILRLEKCSFMCYDNTHTENTTS